MMGSADLIHPVFPRLKVSADGHIFAFNNDGIAKIFLKITIMDCHALRTQLFPTGSSFPKFFRGRVGSPYLHVIDTALQLLYGGLSLTNDSIFPPPPHASKP